MVSEIASTARAFPVADVEPATMPLKEAPYREVFEGLLAAERLAKGVGYRPIEGCSRHTPSLLAGVGYHPLVAALHLAYAGHRPIALSPDMIWLLICQGVAHHINAYAEELRPKFVQHPGRLTLEVERGKDVPYRKGPGDDLWPGVFEAFSSQLRAQIGPAYQLLVPSFSTTGPVERAAAEVTLCDSIRSYYHYMLETVTCGIPAITLEGTVADWQGIVERVEGFGDLDLEWWLRPLRPVLQQFASASAGEVDVEFWNRMYRIRKPGEASEADSVTGWIGAFFPYLIQDGGQATRRNPWFSGERNLDELLNPQEAGRRLHPFQDLDAGFLHDGQFSSGLAKAPITWNERDTDGRLLHRWDMRLLGGFVGVAQDTATFRLRPEIGWAVRQRSRR